MTKKRKTGTIQIRRTDQKVSTKKGIRVKVDGHMK